MPMGTQWTSPVAQPVAQLVGLTQAHDIFFIIKDKNKKLFKALIKKKNLNRFYQQNKKLLPPSHFVCHV